MSYKRLIETYKITDQLAHKISLSGDEELVFLNIEYEDRLKIEKSFKNNAIGLLLMQQIRDKLNTEEKVFKYLGIGELKE